MAFVDPTHVNIMTEETFDRYFIGENPGALMYGYSGRLKSVYKSLERFYLLSILRKFNYMQTC